MPRSGTLRKELSELGKATADQAAACDPFLILEENLAVQVQSRRMFNGQLRFDADQSANPDSVVLLPGGKWSDGVLISGSFATFSMSPVAGTA